MNGLCPNQYSNSFTNYELKSCCQFFPHRKVIRLSNISEQIAFELPKDPVTIHLKDFITESQLNSQDDSIPNVNLVFNNVPYAEADVNDWKIS